MESEECGALEVTPESDRQSTELYQQIFCQNVTSSTAKASWRLVAVSQVIKMRTVLFLVQTLVFWSNLEISSV